LGKRNWEIDMNAGNELNSTRGQGIVEPAFFPGTESAAIPTLEPDELLEGGRAFDESLLAEVPYALEAYMSRQCFGLC